MKDFIFFAIVLIIAYVVYNLTKTNAATAASAATAQQNANSNILPVLGMSLVPSFISGLSKLFSGVTSPNTNTDQIATPYNAYGGYTDTSDTDSTGYDGSAQISGNGSFISPLTGYTPTLQTLPDPQTGDPLQYWSNAPDQSLPLDPVSNSSMLDLSPGSFAIGSDAGEDD